MKKNIIWIIQSNQVTPTIYEYLQILKNRIREVLNLKFMVPDTSSEIFEKINKLNPEVIKVSTRSATHSNEAYHAKKNLLKGQEFTEGLTFSDVLLLDDFGGGNVIQTTLDLKKKKNICGLIVQIPTPLGSSEAEERVFHSAVLWARENRLPIIGYELLPLDTRWTLTPSLPDGVIVKDFESYEVSR